MNPWLIALLIILPGSWLLELITEVLNLKHAGTALPPAFTDVFDEERYRMAQAYLRDRTRLGLLRSTQGLIVILLAIFAGGFQRLDLLARQLGQGEIRSGLVFVGGIAVVLLVVNLPFAAYSTFVIEERYGFNRTSGKTFILDLIKSVLLGAILGGLVFSGVIWFFTSLEFAWFWAWLAVTGFQLLIMFVAPVVIMPLFNRFEPLPDGELQEQILDYATRQNFAIKGIFTTDGSRRSSKANAYFTGFGKFRRIVLYDTLIKSFTNSELLAILAHEMGHFKKRHIHKRLALGVLSSGLLFFILSYCLENPGLFAAFRVGESSVYASLVFIGILFGPLDTILSIVANRLSCRFEYEADAYAAETLENGAADLSRALKKLSADGLSNLTPHPLKVFLEYEHPPVLHRLRALGTEAVRVRREDRDM